MVLKHSYIFSKDFVLCCLSEDKTFFYGEIIYGRKRLREVKMIKINNFKYYKYWELEHIKKIKYKKVGKKTNYNRYLNLTKKLYIKNYFTHPVMGKLFRLPKKDAIRIINPKKYLELKKSQVRLVNLLMAIFSLSQKNILIGGSSLLNEKMSHNDLDIIIYGKKEGIRSSKILNKITERRENRISINKENFHRRRFKLFGIPICPFSIYNGDNFFETTKIKKIKKSRKISADVIDCSESLFSPARYKVRVNNKNYLLISYFVGHNHLFKNGEKIEFKAPLFEFTKKLIKKQAFVIPIEGSWVKIKGRV